MAKVFSVAVLCFLLITGLAFAQNLSGKYTLSSQGTTLTLTLNQDTQGKIKGTLSSTTGMEFRVEGAVQDNVGVGTCVSNQGGSYFEARPKGNQARFRFDRSRPQQHTGLQQGNEADVQEGRRSDTWTAGQAGISEATRGTPQTSSTLRFAERQIRLLCPRTWSVTPTGDRHFTTQRMESRKGARRCHPGA